MKIATIIIRSLLGIMFILSSVTFFLNKMPPPEPMPANAETFMKGMMAAQYLMPLVKVLELICGLCFISGRWVALANMVILPITVNIFLIHSILLTSGFAIGLAIFLANLFLIYTKRENYFMLLKSK